MFISLEEPVHWVLQFESSRDFSLNSLISARKLKEGVLVYTVQVPFCDSFLNLAGYMTNMELKILCYTFTSSKYRGK